MKNLKNSDERMINSFLMIIPSLLVDEKIIYWEGDHFIWLFAQKTWFIKLSFDSVEYNNLQKYRGKSTIAWGKIWCVSPQSQLGPTPHCLPDSELRASEELLRFQSCVVNIRQFAFHRMWRLKCLPLTNNPKAHEQS